MILDSGLLFFGPPCMSIPRMCVNNRHDFKGWGENQRIILHDKTWFLTLTLCWKWLQRAWPLHSIIAVFFPFPVQLYSGIFPIILFQI